MKVITSLGGPYVGLDITRADRWGGNDSNRFVGEASSSANDYEAAGFSPMVDQTLPAALPL